MAQHQQFCQVWPAYAKEATFADWGSSYGCVSRVHAEVEKWMDCADVDWGGTCYSTGWCNKDRWIEGESQSLLLSPCWKIQRKCIRIYCCTSQQSKRRLRLLWRVIHHKIPINLPKLNHKKRIRLSISLKVPIKNRCRHLIIQWEGIFGYKAWGVRSIRSREREVGYHKRKCWELQSIPLLMWWRDCLSWVDHRRKIRHESQLSQRNCS